MKTALIVILTVLCCIGCGSKPVRSTEPVSYDEYKKWRTANDPTNAAYAGYKQWEGAYRRWKKAQESQ